MDDSSTIQNYPAAAGIDLSTALEMTPGLYACGLTCCDPKLMSEQGANLFRLPVAEVSKEVRSFERKQSPQCGVATIENAGIIYLLGSTKKPDQL